MVREITGEELRKISTLYGVKIVIKNLSKLGNIGGLSDGENRTVILDKNVTHDRDLCLNVLFHELGHQYCYDNNKFVNYHKLRSTFELRKKIAVRAERYADKIGERLLSKYDKSVIYEKLYETEEARKFIIEYQRMYSHC